MTDLVKTLVTGIGATLSVANQSKALWRHLDDKVCFRFEDLHVPQTCRICKRKSK